MDKIFNEDCFIGMKKLPDNSIDMILTDLPFGMVDCGWDKEINLKNFWSEVNRVLKHRSSAVMFASGKFSTRLINSNFDNYKYKWIWVKNAATNFLHSKNCPMHKYEEILIFSDGVINHESIAADRRMKYNPQGVKEKPPSVRTNQLHKFNGCYGARPSHQETVIATKEGYPSDVLFYDAVHSSVRVHPTQKPVDLLEYLIKTYTNEGEVVLDATIGSGSTAVAAINTNRHFIGFELDKKYFNVANQRIAETLAKKRQALF